MYHLHIYRKDTVGFEPILHSLNDEKRHFGRFAHYLTH